MTRDEAKKLLPIIQAYADGKVVQAFSSILNKWIDIENPAFRDSEWRIKPEPMEVWLTFDRDGVKIVHDTKKSAERYAHGGQFAPYTIHRMREVED